jgi:hypothetical protein
MRLNAYLVLHKADELIAIRFAVNGDRQLNTFTQQRASRADAPDTGTTGELTAPAAKVLPRKRSQRPFGPFLTAVRPRAH